MMLCVRCWGAHSDLAECLGCLCPRGPELWGCLVLQQRPASWCSAGTARSEQGRAHGDPAPHPAPASLPGPPEEGPRVVFMVDLWHPNVAAAERQALDFIFAPGR